MKRVSAATVLMAILYFGGYGVVRWTHTQYWFDKTTEETGSYTFFDTYSDTDNALARTYYPLLVVDSLLFARRFEQDKW